MEVTWLLSTFSLCVSVIIVLKYFKKQSFRLPPGPMKLPILGNLHQLMSENTPPHRCLGGLAKVYGSIMHLNLGQVSTVVVSSAEWAKEVTRTNDADFANRPKLAVGKYVFYDYSNIGLAPYGDYWRQVRKIATLELFTPKRVKSFDTIRKEEIVELIRSVAVEAATKESSLVNFSDLVFDLTFNVISRVIFSKKGKDQRAFSAVATKMSNVLAGFGFVDYYPSLKWLPSVTGMERRLYELIDESNRILEPMILEHKDHKDNNQVDSSEDIVDVLLKYHEGDSKDADFSLTTNNIKGIVWEIFGAGIETSSVALEWAMSELLKNPEAMKRAQDEVRKVYGETKGEFDESKLDELKYIKAVVKETLRLHPPSPLLVPRETTKACKIGAYDVPAKTRVILNAWAIARDPKYWNDPDTFKPERFEGSSVDFKGGNFEFMPFGAGRRMCPGMTLGVANVEVPLAMMLYHFDWKLAAGIKPEDLDMDELFGLTVRRKNKLHVTALPYINSCLV